MTAGGGVPRAAAEELRPGFTPSRRVLLTALATATVAAVTAYAGVQLMRVVRAPELAVTSPSIAVLTVDQGTTSYTLRGTSRPGAMVVIAARGGSQPYLVPAARDGTWSAVVELRAGPNQFDISATDPTSGLSAESGIQLFIRVPAAAVVAAQPSRGPSGPVAGAVGTPAPPPVTLAVTVERGTVWIKVWVDGRIDPSIGAGGRSVRGPSTLTFTAHDSVEVRTGSSGQTSFVINGTRLGTLGPSGAPETWLFAPPQPPQKTKRS